MITITRSSFRLGVERRRTLLIFIGWWWVCIGSWDARMMDVAELDAESRRFRQRQRRSTMMRRRG